jgi:hypothetical protein
LRPDRIESPREKIRPVERRKNDRNFRIHRIENIAGKRRRPRLTTAGPNRRLRFRFRRISKEW